jgi:hypothetical protein
LCDNIQGGGSLVENHEPGLVDQTQGNANPLKHATRELVTIEVEHSVREANDGQERVHTLIDLFLGCLRLVDSVYIHNLLSDSVHRTEAVHRLLEDNCDILPSDASKDLIATI